MPCRSARLDPSRACEERLCAGPLAHTAELEPLHDEGLARGLDEARADRQAAGHEFGERTVGSWRCLGNRVHR